ncbi:hypothetical protein K438DRAFT_1989543 [Mycena galopus ATCC 62051]|nr:hypothetical protein K438DRAFT_1989543 [Mycena galopus ATCC 62051]
MDPHLATETEAIGPKLRIARPTLCWVRLGCGRDRARPSARDEKRCGDELHGIDVFFVVIRHSTLAAILLSSKGDGCRSSCDIVATLPLYIAECDLRSADNHKEDLDTMDSRHLSQRRSHCLAVKFGQLPDPLH